MDRGALLWPVAIHLGLVLFLYAWLSVVRWQARAGRDVATRERAVAANLSNQFEAPVLFYALVAMLWSQDAVAPAYVVLAWVFALGRFPHTAVQTLTGNVLLRGGVFTINFVALAAMWALFLERNIL